MIKAEVIFIPAPGVGHLVSTIEFSKLLISRDDRISISILIMNLSSDASILGITQSLQKDVPDRLAFVDIPALDETIMTGLQSKGYLNFLMSFLEIQKTKVRDIVASILSRSVSSKLAGLVIDFFCTPMIDVANEFNVPTYVFFTPAAASLGFMFYSQSLKDNENQEIYEYKDSDAELSIPSFSNPVPAKVLPSMMLSKDGSDIFTNISRRLREAKAIVVNTVMELEAHSIKSLVEDENTPLLHHVGPIIKSTNGESTSQGQLSNQAIISWLDSHPPSSVVFLCFGSMGTFDPEQVTEIACALELSGQRFLWCLRRPSQEKETGALPKNYDNYNEVFPEGFLERTAEIGKVIGWAPQAEEIERGIRCLMDGESEMRKKVKEMKDTCRKATAEGGSSYNSAGQFIEDLMSNIRNKRGA
ncbi:Glycosyltransferase [Heracleum sosnowskyi]|uniref:Glycosyltransferase n=1 Tax=Heracleum sosnowskyi TaxID=360622 RepID=A0AAD8GS89_9APIA|nr:Glycosyltransferase [Heracleum sosnowskyi]